MSPGFGLFTIPVLGGPRLVHWLARLLIEEAEKERLNEGRVRGQLLELVQRLDDEDIEEEEFDRRENALLEELAAIRKAKERLGA